MYNAFVRLKAKCSYGTPKKKKKTEKNWAFFFMLKIPKFNEPLRRSSYCFRFLCLLPKTSEDPIEGIFTTQ